MHLRNGFEWDGEYIVVPIENIWARVRRWAKRNGYRWVGSYGVEGVAPT